MTTMTRSAHLIYIYEKTERRRIEVIIIKQLL